MPAPIKGNANESTNAIAKACVLKPEDIADKLGVKATNIGVYARTFEDVLKGHMEFTEGGHRRFSSTGFKLLHEIHHLIKVDGMTYAQTKEEMTRRMNNSESMTTELATYDMARQLSEMSEIEKQFYNTMLAVQDENVRLREQINKFVMGQELEREITNQKIQELTQTIQDLGEHLDKGSDWATITLNMIEMRGKPGFFAKLFGLRSEEEEKKIAEYCKSIIENDRAGRSKIKGLASSAKNVLIDQVIEDKN